MNWIGWVAISLLVYFLLMVGGIFAIGIYASLHPKVLDSIQKPNPGYAKFKLKFEPFMRVFGKYLTIAAMFTVVTALFSLIGYIVIIVVTIVRGTR